MLQDIPTPTSTLHEARPFVLETERLMLRRPTLADVKAIATLANDHRARSFGGKALAPVIDAKPVTEFRRLRRAPIDADRADRRVIVFDQKHGLARIVRHRAHERDRIVLRIGMRQAAGIFRDAAIVGEMRDRFDIRERRLA